MFDFPVVSFDVWRRFSTRPRLADEHSVPPDFGILGIYLLSAWESDPAPSEATKRHLSESVIYIGMSTHVMRRLDRHHDAVRRYSAEFNDPERKRLFYSQWESDWTNSDREHIVRNLALLKYIESALIAQYAVQFHRRPALNRE